MSIQTEQQVIYSLLMDNAQMQNCDLEPQEFQQWQNQEIYRVIRSLTDEKQVADVLTVAEKLESDCPEHQFLPYMSELIDKGYKSGAIEQHAAIIRKNHRKSQALAIADNLKKGLQSGGNENAVDEAIQELMNLNTVGKNYDHSMKEVMYAATKMVSEASEMDGIRGITTGLADLDDTLGGFNDTDLIVIPARPAMGKAQPLSSKVLMANGKFKQMADVRLGDRLASPDGRPSFIEGIFPQGVRPIYSMTLSDGRVVECDLEHLWTIECCKFDGRKTVTTKELMQMLERERFQNRIRVVGHSGDFGEKVDTLIDPWLIGFLIGDGCLAGSSVRFSTGEDFILQKVSSRIPDGCSIKHVGGYDYRIISSGKANPVLDAIRAHKLNTGSHQKVIPDSLMRADRVSRLSLLLGLIESDGWSQKSSLQFSSSSKTLAIQVQALSRSLGGSASLRQKKKIQYVASGEAFPARDAFICSICFDDMADLIESERVSKHLGTRRKTAQPIIRSIKYDRDDLAQCIKVTHPDSLYITDGYVVTHNTAFMLNLALSANCSAGVISTEQAHEQIGLRFVSIEGKIDSQKVRTGGFYDTEWDDFGRAVNRLAVKPIRINDESNITISRAIRQARDWKYKYDIKILFVDYLQHIEHGNKNLPLHERVGDIAKALKNLAKELKIPVVALGQVNRECEKRPDKRPYNSDIANAGEIEKEADVIMSLYRDEVYNEDTPDKGIAELIVSKNRHGPIGTIRCVFVGKFMRFEQIAAKSYAEMMNDS